MSDGDILTVVEENRQLAKELGDKKGELREAVKTADRVPALEQEVNHANAALARCEEKFSTQARLTDEQKEKVRELESRIRAQEVIESERNDAENRLEAALKSVADTEEALKSSEVVIGNLKADLAAAKQEIERLKPHEAQTRALIAAIDKGRELG